MQSSEIYRERCPMFTKFKLIVKLAEGIDAVVNHFGLATVIAFVIVTGLAIAVFVPLLAPLFF